VRQIAKWTRQARPQMAYNSWSRLSVSGVHARLRGRPHDRGLDKGWYRPVWNFSSGYIRRRREVRAGHQMARAALKQVNRLMRRKQRRKQRRRGRHGRYVAAERQREERKKKEKGENRVAGTDYRTEWPAAVCSEKKG